MQQDFQAFMREQECLYKSLQNDETKESGIRADPFFSAIIVIHDAATCA